MKKIISLFIALLLCIFQVFICLSSEAKNTTKKRTTYKTVLSKDLASFYPGDTLLITYISYTEKNIDKIKSLIAKYSKDDDLNKHLFEGLNIFSNLTTSFGPEITFGILKPEPCNNELYLSVVKTKTESFSPNVLKGILAPSDSSEIIKYKGFEVHKSKTKKALSYSKVNEFILISNSTIAINKAIDNHLENSDNILSSDKAQESASMIPKDYLVSIITNNISLINYGPALSGDASASSETDSKNIIDKNLSKLKKQHKDIAKSLNLKEDQIQYLNKYYEGFMQTDSFTSYSLVLEGNYVNVKAYSPYNLEFLSSINPKMQAALEKMLKANKKIITAKLFPSNTYSYIMLANLGNVGNILDTIDLNDFQNMLQTGKFFVTAFSGLDLDKQILPIFNGYNIIGAINNGTSSDIVGYISYDKSSLNNLYKIAEKINNIEDSIQIGKESINKFHFTKITSNKNSFELLYGKRSKSIIIGTSQSVNDLISKANLSINSLYKSDIFDFYKNKVDKSNLFEMFINVDQLKDAKDKKLNNIIPEEVSNYIKTVFLSYKTTRKRGHLFNLFVELK